MVILIIQPHTVGWKTAYSDTRMLGEYGKIVKEYLMSSINSCLIYDM